eukprot:scaffold33561_cov28-Tisochrysis_lutea.AAC.3
MPESEAWTPCTTWSRGEETDALGAHGRPHRHRRQPGRVGWAYLRLELLEGGPDVGTPEDGAEPRGTRPGAAREHERRRTLRGCHRLREEPEPLRRIVSVIAVTAAARTLAVRFVEPEGVDSLLVVARPHHLRPDEGAARADRRVDNPAAKSAIGEAASGAQRLKLCRLGLHLGPE